jgi:hypothetical protein
VFTDSLHGVLGDRLATTVASSRAKVALTRRFASASPTGRGVSASADSLSLWERAGLRARGKRPRHFREQLMSNDGYRGAAQRLADEIAQLPPPSASVRLLEGLAKDFV